jgi:hypothetical protein
MFNFVQDVKAGFVTTQKFWVFFFLLLSGGNGNTPITFKCVFFLTSRFRFKFDMGSRFKAPV